MQQIVTLKKIEPTIKKYSVIISLFMSLGAVWAFTYALKLNEDSVTISNSIISVVLLIVFSKVINISILKLSKRLFIYSVILGLVFSALLIAGTEIYLYGAVNVSSQGIKLILKVISLGFIFSAIISLFLDNIPWIREKIFNKDQCFANWSNIKFYMACWGVIFLSWVPILLAYYPGSFAYDVEWQINQAFNHSLNSHHPIAHTIYLYICLKIGKMIHSYNTGVLIHSITQMLMLSAAFAYASYFIRKLKCPKILQIFALLYFSLFPLNPLFSINATKDVLFAAAILMIFIFILDMGIDTRKFFSSKYKMLVFIVLSFIMMVLRNNGIYVFLLAIPILIIGFRSCWKKISVLCIVPILYI